MISTNQEIIILLFGGVSSERRVSVASAHMLSEHLPEAILWFWSVDGQIYQPNRTELVKHQHPFEIDFEPQGSAIYESLTSALTNAPKRAVFFLALHGAGAEDGSLLRQFESLGLAYTGSGSVASAAAFDKSTARNIVQAKGISVAEALLIEPPWPYSAELSAANLLARHGKLVAKPCADGSSIGLTFIEESERLTFFFRQRRESTDQSAWLLEAFVVGRELTVGVIEDHDGGLKELPCSEVQLDSNRAFDYAGKYLADGAVEVTPALIDPELASAAQNVALVAHRTLGCRGYSRTDIIVSGSDPIYLETNTLPGLTSASFIPQQLRAAGIQFSDFIQMQIDLARRPRS